MSGSSVPTPHHLGGAWPGAATDLQWQPSEIPSEIEQDYHDTGRGWSVAMPPMQQEPPAFARRMTAGQRRTGGAALGEVGAALVGRLGRYTFNLMLLAIILALLAIPVSMGLARLAALQPQSSPAVAAAKTPRPVPTPYSGYASYRADLFSLSYPKDWTQTTVSHNVSPGGSEQEIDFTSPDKTSFFGVGTLAAVPNDQSQFTLQAVARGFPTAGTTSYVIVGSSSTGKVVDGQSTIEIDFTCDYLVTAQRLVVLHGTALLRTQGLTTYVVMYAAPNNQFSSAQGQTFNPMLASLLLDA
jgi:hypothetical protein